MVKLTAVLFLAFGLMRAEVHTLTLGQAVSRALDQNPDLVIARLDQAKAQQAVRQARDPFFPKAVVGSGLAYTNGFPMSMEGAAPSIVQGRVTESFFNRPQSYLVAQARENSKGAAIAASSKLDEVALRTADLYLEADRVARLAQVVRGQIESLGRVAETVRVQVDEGRELPLASKRADLNLAQARYQSQVLDSDSEYLEGQLAAGLGFGPSDRVHPAQEDRRPSELPASADEAVQSALASSKEIKRLESALFAKGFEVSSQKAVRLPKVDLVAQYALFGQYNNYQDYFRVFQRNNGEIGLSFQVPLLVGPGAGAAAAAAQADAAKLRLQVQQARSRIALDTRHDFEKVKQAEAARDIAKLDLDLARSQISALLAQMAEGRASLRQIEDARVIESDKWIAYYDANCTLEKARLNVLSQTGALVAALKQEMGDGK